MLDESRTDCPKGPATDPQAALLALHDLAPPIRCCARRPRCTTARPRPPAKRLAFCCQSLVPKLAKADQVTILLAILGHREPPVRRFAIGRLAELEDPATAKALSGRLATEGNELRPLVELALAQVRKQKMAPPTDEIGATQNLQACTAKTRWLALDLRGRSWWPAHRCW